VPAIRRQAASAWALELKHDGYRLQIHVKDGWVLLYMINPKAPAATRECKAGDRLPSGMSLRDDNAMSASVKSFAIAARWAGPRSSNDARQVEELQLLTFRTDRLRDEFLDSYEPRRRHESVSLFLSFCSAKKGRHLLERLQQCHLHEWRRTTALKPYSDQAA
jgi:hypothetical protein